MNRGEHLQNLLNIRQSPVSFKGEVTPSADPAFKQFQSVDLGIRAASMIILNYQLRRKLACVMQIINRWAPPVENDTQGYIRAVCTRLNVGATDLFDVTKAGNLAGLVKAMIYQEQGRCLASDVQIFDGVDAALEDCGFAPDDAPASA